MVELRLQKSQKTGWLLLAVLAIAVALLCLVALHAQSGDGAHWAAILPLLFVGLISPLSLLGRVSFHYNSRTPDAPLLTVSFQRPPPQSLSALLNRA